MSTVGRNDPCPCGSGKKFKRCCLAREAPPAGAYTPGERESALEALLRFSMRPEFEPDERAAQRTFWPAALDRLSEEESRRVFKHEQSHVGYREWFAFDYRLRSGATVVETFLGRQGDRLRSGERRYLERMRLSHFRLYEVAAVRPGEGLDLVDLWGGQRLRVRERLGTRQIVQWDVLATRVVLGPEDEPVLEGMPYLYPVESKATIVRALRRARRLYAEHVASSDLPAFFKWAGALYHDFWLKHVVLRPRPKVVTTEGDAIIFAKVFFDVRDAQAVREALAGHPDVAPQDDGSFRWSESTPEFSRSFGVFVFDGRRLIFETMSKQRAERGRRFVEGLVGEAVAYRVTRYEDVERAAERTSHDRAEPEPPDIPPETQEELVGQYYEQHYRKWVDEPLPALRGRTPREAAAQARERPRVVALLKEMENMSARQRLAGRAAYDFGWMWGELGIERPGRGVTYPVTDG